MAQVLVEDNNAADTVVHDSLLHTVLTAIDSFHDDILFMSVKQSCRELPHKVPHLHRLIRPLGRQTLDAIHHEGSV